MLLFTHGSDRPDPPLPEVPPLPEAGVCARALTRYAPATDLGPLFEAVQLAGVFPDSKTFVDARPLMPPAEVVGRWEAQRRRPGFDLGAFVRAHFALPDDAGLPHAPPHPVPMAEHLRRHWSVLARWGDRDRANDALLPLPAPYVVPGGRFREIYYWDSYFTMQGLARSGRHDLVRSLLANTAHLIRTVGHVPNGNRTYYLSRSQPPYFGAMLTLLAAETSLAETLPYLDALRAEYAYWMDGAGLLAVGEAHRRVARVPLPNSLLHSSARSSGGPSALLNRYWDDLPTPRPESYREDVHLAHALPEAARPALWRHLRAAAESGWDFSARWMDDPADLATLRTTDLLPIDLNATLYHTERVLARMHSALGDVAEAARFEAAADARRDALRALAWDADAGFFFDVDLRTGARRTDRPTLAAAAALYFGVATEAQAAAVATVLARDFLCPGGFVTTCLRSGEQWDAPNGWAPLQWLTIAGLRRYGYTTLASEARTRWLSLNQSVFAQTGKMMEKYDVTDLSRPAGGGEYPLQDGFGWTNGVALALLALEA